MHVDVPPEIQPIIDEIDTFIEEKIKPLQADHPQYFDHRREYARTDWENGGIPDAEWEALIENQRELADEAGLFRYVLPEELGGRDGSNLGMAVIREYLAERGPGLHNVLQQEAAIVGNFPIVKVLRENGTAEQREMIEPAIEREVNFAFGLSEPDHGSDASWMDTTAERDGDEWVINGKKRWNSAMHEADFDIVFARTSGDDGEHAGITAFLVPVDNPGLEIEKFWWTFNMPTDHAEVDLDHVRVPDSAILGEEGKGLRLAQHFLHENRIRQAAASLGAAQLCINESVDFAKQRKTWGELLANRQAIQFPLAELHTEAELLRRHIRHTARLLDRNERMEISDKVSMANYYANNFVCRAADQAIQTHGGQGYTRDKPFEHIYRHHRRYRITEGSEEIQKRRVAGYLFDFIG